MGGAPKKPGVPLALGSRVIRVATERTARAVNAERTALGVSLPVYVALVLAERHRPGGQAGPLSLDDRVQDHAAVYGGKGVRRDKLGYSLPEPQQARCRCGTRSEPLPSNRARERWQREHQAAMLARTTAGAGADA